MRLAAEQYRLNCLRKIYQANRHRAAAEEHHADKQDCEMKILEFVNEQSMAMDSQLALGLARAARDTLSAENRLIQARIAECQQSLEFLNSMAEESCSYLNEANGQITSILHMFQLQGLSFKVSESCLEHIFSINKPSPSSPISTDEFPSSPISACEILSSSSLHGDPESNSDSELGAANGEL